MSLANQLYKDDFSTQNATTLPNFAHSESIPFKVKTDKGERFLDPCNRFVVYTDGSWLKRPFRAGGYAAILRDSLGNVRELSGCLRNTTIARMEMLAVITALKAIRKPSQVTLITDSNYIFTGIRHVRNWVQHHWISNQGYRVGNCDLWSQVVTLCDFHAVEVFHIKGHCGNVYNERCDRLAFKAAKRAQ